MPRLRFTRDERGYEHTFLVHTTGRRGRERSRVLYWFRSPSAVRVGRPALDSAGIRAIEEANPGIAFDWPTILDSRRVDAEPVDGSRARRARPSREREARESRLPPELTTPPNPGQCDPPVEEHDPADRGEPQSTRCSAVHRALGSEGLVRVRARYAEVLARISSQVTDAAAADELRALAERLNPDAWVTDEEVRGGLESFEPVLETVRQRLGRPRRRRVQPEPPEAPTAAGNRVAAPSLTAASPATPPEDQSSAD